MEKQTEYSNGWLARMWGAYMPNDFIVIGVAEDAEDWEGYKLARLWNGGGVDIWHSEHGQHSFTFDEIKMALTPLQDITNEHLIYIAYMYGGDRAVLNDDGFLQIISNGQLVKHFILTHTKHLPQLLVDYLRQWYDCGFGEVPSLIDAGLAVKKTN